eukprot:4956063-Pyramimonas_sp.AAC.1
MDVAANAASKNALRNSKPPNSAMCVAADLADVADAPTAATTKAHDFPCVGLLAARGGRIC